MTEENILLTNKHILICIEKQMEKVTLTEYNINELKYIRENFCGSVLSDVLEFNDLKIDADIYICGDIQTNMCLIEQLNNFSKITLYIISEFSWNYENYINEQNCHIIKTGLVPINIYNTGVYFRNCFGSNEQTTDYFNSIVREHEFQSLTESNKPTNAFRTGIYITKVEIEHTNNNDTCMYFRDEKENLKVKTNSENSENYKWHLLRCSSNLSGPTDNTKMTDNEIITQTNNLASKFFKSKVSMNHVLAQIYTNSLTQTNKGVNKESKAKIKAHSDKTKDMPSNGLMGFCSFYQGYNGDSFIDGHKKSQTDIFNYVYGNSNTSILTNLRFKLKKDVQNPNNKYKQQFDIILYPNSVFIMSLMTNRIYTHEIIPSGLPIDKIPTRMGYVIRCSNTLATYKNNKVYICKDNQCTEMIEPDIEGVQKLKDLYYKENVTSEKIIYEGFNFSLNKGDYSKPYF